MTAETTFHRNEKCYEVYAGYKYMYLRYVNQSEVEHSAYPKLLQVRVLLGERKVPKG